MKNNFLPIIALLTVASVSVSAQELGSAHPTYPDSLRTYKLDEVVITSTRATETTPIAYTNVDKAESDQDFCELLNAKMTFSENDEIAFINEYMRMAK